MITPPTQVLSVTALISSFQMICYKFIVAYYMCTIVENHFFRCHKWGRLFGRSSSIKCFGVENNVNFLTNIHVKDWKSSHSAHSIFKQLNLVGTWAGWCFMAMRLTKFRYLAFKVFVGRQFLICNEKLDQQHEFFSYYFVWKLSNDWWSHAVVTYGLVA
mgnify:CR=1 FL=1